MKNNGKNHEKYKVFKDYVENEVLIKEKIWRTTEAVLDEGIISYKKGSPEEDDQLDLKYKCSDCDREFDIREKGSTQITDFFRTHFEEYHKLKEIKICHLCKATFPDEDHGVITHAGHWLCHNCNENYNWDWEEKRYYLND